MGEIKINIPNETIAIWLTELLKEAAEEAEGAASNEELFALGTDGESSDQHKENAEVNRQYAEILNKACSDIEKRWEVKA